MAMKSVAIGLLVLPFSGEAACECKATPENPKQEPATDAANMAYVGTQAAYGWGCKAHDMGEGDCENATTDDASLDWCFDQWCIVEHDCDLRRIVVSYTADPADVFSYEACDANFAGNSWVGYCKNCLEFPDSFCPCGGLDRCPCKPGAPKKTSATNKPAYVGEAAAYGSGCKAHDKGEDACDVSDPADWCLDQFCIVDPDDCDLMTREVSYTGETDYFSYETCDDGFTGNSWVGYCKNCAADFPDSYCTCGGKVGCPCLAGAAKKTSATDKPAYVGEAVAYGSGCKAHDAGEDMCKTSTKTGDGQDDDWCLDKFCIVDPNNCNLKTREVSYTAQTDYFSYDTCDDDFAGNGWVGRCKCEDNNMSFCTCSDDTSVSLATATRLGVAGAATIVAAVFH